MISRGRPWTYRAAVSAFCLFFAGALFAQNRSLIGQSAPTQARRLPRGMLLTR
jgi:hypothetical protein